MHFTHGEFVKSSHSERGKDTWIQGEKGARDPKTLGKIPKILNWYKSSRCYKPSPSLKIHLMQGILIMLSDLIIC